MDMELFWTVQGVIGPFVSLVTMLPVVIYVVARWRGYREGAPHDPHLGIKVALSFFRIIAYQVALAGLFLLVYGMLTDLKDDAQEAIMRTAAGLLVPGLLIYVSHWVALSKTNHEALPGVTRMFAGLSLVQTGIVGFIALIMACVIFFQEGDAGEPGRVAWAMVMVYVVAWGLQGMTFMRNVSYGPPPSVPPGPSAPY